MSVERAASLSDCGRYRYWLARWWSSVPRVTFVMLNPSTADADVDDPTIRRCMGYARTWGYGGIGVVNLYALRSTDPRQLWAADDPIGSENDTYLTAAALHALQSDTPIIAAWGANARQDRIAAVQALPFMDRLSALALTKTGQPRHPLYLRGDLAPVPWIAP
jgi:hypothetical protein